MNQFIRETSLRYQETLVNSVGATMVPVSLNYADFFNKANTRLLNGNILYEKPVSGKTLFAKVLTILSCLNFIFIKGSQILSLYMTVPGEGIKELFTKAIRTSPRLLFIDPTDRLLPCHPNQRVVSEGIDGAICKFLTQLDGVENLCGNLVFGATKRIGPADQVLLRNGQFNLLFDFTLPGLKHRKKYSEFIPETDLLTKTLTSINWLLKPKT